VYFVNFPNASVVKVASPMEGMVIVPSQWSWGEVQDAFKARFEVCVVPQRFFSQCIQVSTATNESLLFPRNNFRYHRSTT
jgi:hypothetical protein